MAQEHVLLLKKYFQNKINKYECRYQELERQFLLCIILV